MKQKIILVVGASLALTTLSADGQPITQQDVSGTECWNAGQGPGGPILGALCINQVRNGSGLRVFPGVTTTSILTTMTQNDGTLFWSGAQPTTWVITLVAPPFDGEKLTVATDTTIVTRLSFVSGAGTTMSAAITTATLTPGTPIILQYNRGSTTWVRIQ